MMCITALFSFKKREFPCTVKWTICPFFSFFCWRSFCFLLILSPLKQSRKLWKGYIYMSHQTDTEEIQPQGAFQCAAYMAISNPNPDFEVGLDKEMTPHSVLCSAISCGNITCDIFFSWSYCGAAVTHGSLTDCAEVCCHSGWSKGSHRCLTLSSSMFPAGDGFHEPLAELLAAQHIQEEVCWVVYGVGGCGSQVQYKFSRTTQEWVTWYTIEEDR